jgi:hypothetical protein
LFLRDTIDVAYLLLLTKLDTVLGEHTAMLALILRFTGRRRSLLKDTFRGKTLLSFEEELFSGATTCFTLLV